MRIGNIKDIIRRKNDYQKTFSTPEGKRVLADILAFCNYRTSSYVQNDRDATLINEGLRLYALRAIRFLEMDEKELTRISQLNNYDDEEGF